MRVCKYVHMCMHIYVHMCVLYIYAGPLMAAPRLRGVLHQLPVPSPTNHFNHKLPIKVSIISSHFQSSHLQVAVCQSGISFQLFASQQSGELVTAYCRPRANLLPYPGSVIPTWAPPTVLLQNHHISSLSPGPSKIRKGWLSQGHQKSLKGHLKPPPGHQFSETMKK